MCRRLGKIAYHKSDICGAKEIKAYRPLLTSAFRLLHRRRSPERGYGLCSAHSQRSLRGPQHPPGPSAAYALSQGTEQQGSPKKGGQAMQ